MENIKILIVDDEEDLCEILSIISETRLFNDIANLRRSIEKALDSYDLILLDAMGPMWVQN